MAIKWKNKLYLVLATLFCLGGWYLTYASLTRMNTSEGFNDYFNHQVTDSLYIKENIDDFPKTKLEDISMEQIDAYRLRFGDFGTQVEDIRSQYLAELSQVTDSDKIKDLEKERDVKIKAIIENFTNDDVVKEKIIKEEAEYLKKHKKSLLQEIEPFLSDAENLYQYYYKDEGTGVIYTNIAGLSKYSSAEAIEKAMKEKGTGKIHQDSRQVSIYPYIKEEYANRGLFENFGTNFKGSYMITKGSVLDKQLKAQAESKQLFSKLIYVGIFSMIIGVIILYLYINTQFISEWFKRISLDIALLLFLGLGFIAAGTAITIYPYNLGILNNLYGFGLFIVLGFFALLISFIALKILWHGLLPKYRVKSLEEELKETVVYRVYSLGIQLFNKLPIWTKILFLIVIIAINLLLVWFFFDTYGRVRKLTLGLFLIGIISLEVKLVTKPIQKFNKLLIKPKEMLVEYDQEVSGEVSLAEAEKELSKLNELIEVSQKDTMQSEMLKAELLTNVSHDLRTPLTSIITYGELLAQTNSSEQEQIEYIKIINKKAQRMKHLIDDLFEVTKMNNGEIILDKTEVNLGHLLEQSVSEYSDEFREHDLKFIFHKPEAEIILNLDGERMWRVFDNMLGNALKYSMPETRVYLRVEQQGNVARIELKNISRHELNEDADQLVEKFKRGDSSRHTEGSGLGLAIVNSIVSLHEGNLDILVDGDMFKLIIYLPI